MIESRRIGKEGEFTLSSCRLRLPGRLERPLGMGVRRVDDTDGDHHLQIELREPGFCFSLATLAVMRGKTCYCAPV